MSSLRNPFYRDPFVFVLTFIWTLPFFYHSADGLEFYLLDQWGISYSIFLFFWSVLLLFLLIWRVTHHGKRASFIFLTILISTYLGLLIISTGLWIQKRVSFLGENGHWIMDPEFMIRHRPNFHWKGMVTHEYSRSSDCHNISIDLDEEGFRNPSPVPEKIDVAFLGDSFTFGGQVEQSELFSSLTSRELYWTGRNYGINGIGQGTQLRVLEKYILPRKPKWLVVQIFDNDPADNLWYFGWKKEPKSEGEKKQWIIGRTDAPTNYPWFGIFTLQIPREILKNLLFRATDRSVGFLAHFPNKKIHFYMPPWPNDYNTPPLQDFPLSLSKALNDYSGSVDDPAFPVRMQELAARFCAERNLPPENRQAIYNTIFLHGGRYLATRELLGKIITTAQEHEMNVVVVRISTAWLTYRHKLTVAPGSPKSMREFLEADLPGIPVLDDFLESFVKEHHASYISTLRSWKDANEFYYWRYEPHLNTAGHKAVADLLIQEIRNQPKSSNESPPNPKSTSKSQKRD
jgi:hypothetical protein